MKPIAPSGDQDNLTHASDPISGSVEILRTNVHSEADATILVQLLQSKFPGCEINFDLEDCDRILRIAGANHSFNLSEIQDLVASKGFFSEVLP
jgi:hypothetical protein